MILLTAVALALQAQTPQRVEGRGRPTVEVPRLVADAVVDGVLDEAVWSEAVRLAGFSQYEPVDGRPAEERTEVRLWYSPDAIWFGIEAFDSQPGTIRATNADRDNIDNDDHVIIYLDTFNDRRRSFFFGVNPLGVQQDGIRSEGASSPGRMFGGNIDTNPDFYYESRGRVTDGGYVVEVRIPFKSLRLPGAGEQSWGINILREIKRTGYSDTWTDARRASNSFLQQAGTLSGLHDLERGVVIEAQPFLTATANGARSSATGAFDRESVDPDVGINARVGLTNYSLDATINPDFSQVESDVSQVTENERFALFFPEKRPFFLENIDLFATPNQLVYTRQIANPLAGAKITGKAGAIGLAHLTAVDEGRFGARDALFNVTRLRRDFGSGSLAGMVFTDRSDLDGPGYNRVLAADTRITFAKLYFFETQLGTSWSGDEAGSRHAPVWTAAVDRTGRIFGFNYTITGFGEDFEARSGFVPRSDIVTARGFNRVSFFGSRGALLETFTVFAGPTRIWVYDEFARERAIEGNETANLMARFRGGWQLSSRIGRSFVTLDPDDYAGYTVTGPSGSQPYAPADRVSGPGFQLSVTTPTFRRFGATASVERTTEALFAEGTEGRSLNINGSLTLRPTESLRLEARNTVRRLTRSTDGTEFSLTMIPRFKAEYQPRRSLFFRLVGEYSAQRRSGLIDPLTGRPLAVDGEVSAAARVGNLRVDVLASYEPTPGTVAFFGYGSSLASEETRAIDQLERVSDGFFIKLAYQFRN